MFFVDTAVTQTAAVEAALAGTDIRKVGVTVEGIDDDGFEPEAVVVFVQASKDDLDDAVADLRRRAEAAGFTTESEDEHYAEEERAAAAARSAE